MSKCPGKCIPLFFLLLGVLIVPLSGFHSSHLSDVKAQSQPVVLNKYELSELPPIDPHLQASFESADFTENVFVQLTNFSPGTRKISPEAATSWDISGDGLTYTFHLRSDIPWVHHNPITGATTQVTDGAGNPRFVTAEDFEYGFKRACVRAYYGSLVANLIKGCGAVQSYDKIADVPSGELDAVGVTAQDASTLVIELDERANYFLSMTPAYQFSALPKWSIDAYGDNWTQLDYLETTGRFVVDQYNSTIGATYERNPLLPSDLTGLGNIDHVVVQVVQDEVEGYSLWENDQVDISEIPRGYLDSHLANYPGESEQITDLAVFHISIRVTKAPFDDVRVRRAFSAAVDRQSLVAEVVSGQGKPMIHFGPPGIKHAPPLDEVGVGYDVAFAQSELTAAGFPNCQGFPTIELVGYDGSSGLDWMQFVKDEWVNNLGCDPGSINISQIPFWDLLEVIKEDDSTAPHLWILGWGPDYPDENNYVGTIFDCNLTNQFRRPCSNIDDKLETARSLADPADRTNLYYEIEGDLFSESGEYPMMPMFVRDEYQAIHTDLEIGTNPFGGEMWYQWYKGSSAPDADGDGIPDATEGEGDLDDDGTPDYQDTDADGDGIPDSNEGKDDLDSDGFPNYKDLDVDGDRTPDQDEGQGDRDGDGIPDYKDYDPAGYFFDEDTGKILSGGIIDVSGPGKITMIQDGSDGFYQFYTDGTPGTYQINVTLPAEYSWSTSCLKQDPPAFDPTGLTNPVVLGYGEQGTTGYLQSSDCTDFYLTFDLVGGDPEIFNNNFPLDSGHTFADVFADHWAYDWIEALYNAGLTSGYPDGTYRPSNSVTRAEMAVFLLKGMNTGTYSPPVPDGSHPFSDIEGHWAESWMEELYDVGLTSGYPDATYRPQNEVTRAEMAVFLLRAKHGAGYSPPAAGGGGAFSDIAGHWAEDWIEQLADEGITGGYPDGTYRPNNPVNRAEMAVFLVRAFDLSVP